MDFKKTLSTPWFCHVFFCPMHVFCTIFRKHKSTTSSTHNFCNTLCNKKDTPWIALYNATRIGVVTVPQQQWFTADYGTIHTPMQNLLINFNTRVGKPRKHKLFILSKLTKLGVTVFTEWCWLWICLYWVPNLSLYREGCQNLVFPAL